MDITFKIGTFIKSTRIEQFITIFPIARTSLEAKVNRIALIGTLQTLRNLLRLTLSTFQQTLPLCSCANRVIDYQQKEHFVRKAFNSDFLSPNKFDYSLDY